MTRRHPMAPCPLPIMEPASSRIERQRRAVMVEVANDLFEALDGVCNGNWSLHKARAVLERIEAEASK